nr:unnamed protein product [Callosobruchus analis]
MTKSPDRLQTFNTRMKWTLTYPPTTKEQEPAIRLPKSHILIQGKECQRLGLSSFNKIRYSETIVTKHPSAKEDITTHLLKGEFREISDEILQYTCGRRAEAIELRRTSFYPKNDAIASQLENIPPSETFLFDESQFADFFKLHGRFFRFNTQNHSHAAIGYNKKSKYDYTRRSAYVQIGPQNGNAQKSPSANNF